MYRAVIPSDPLETVPIQGLQFDIETFPFNWKVKRTPSDLIALREYLLMMFPQTLVPALPVFN